MKKIYLHIGMPKTGTTAIQLFLKNNEIALKKHNLIFPQDYMALDVQQEFQLSDGNLRGFFPMLNKEEAAIKIKQLHEKYKEDIIISCEHITEDTLTGSLKFFNCLKETCSNANIIVILYLRNQVDLLESFYSEKIKSQNEKRNISELKEKNTYSVQMDYKKLLFQLEKLFGKENCIFQLYEKSAWKNGNLIEDFLEKIGINSTNEFVFSSGKVNSSIDKLALQLKLQINQIPYSIQEIRDTFFIPLLRSTQSREKIGETKYNKSFFSMEDRAEIMKKYEKDNTEIAKTYFGKEILFENKYYEKMEEISLNELVSEMIYVFSSAQVEQNIKLKRLEKQINNFHQELTSISEKEQTKIRSRETSLQTTANHASHILTEENNNLEITVLELLKENENLIEKTKVLQKEAEHAANELKLIKESTCWKCTAPLRKIMDILKHKNV